MATKRGDFRLTGLNFKWFNQERGRETVWREVMVREREGSNRKEDTRRLYTITQLQKASEDKYPRKWPQRGKAGNDERD